MYLAENDKKNAQWRCRDSSSNEISSNEISSNEISSNKRSLTGSSSTESSSTQIIVRLCGFIGVIRCPGDWSNLF